MEQKIGQLLCLGFSGTYPFPDIVEMVEKYHVAGFRVTPSGRKFKRYFGPDHPATPRVVRQPQAIDREFGAWISAPALGAEKYAKTLNELRQRSLESGAGIPLYFATDFEGNQSADFMAPGIQGFPHPMGLAASGDPSLCRKAARVIGKQLSAVGINWLHSPVLDVNTAPLNPEIGTRSYGPDAELVARYAAESLAGFDDAGVIATGKHFPGRGSSVEDVHFGIAVINESAERMRNVHLAPYRALIEKGLPAIMLAHSIFPGIDPEEEIATLSRTVITDVLRREMGFDGVVMTDSFTMGGLVAKYEVADAAIRCINAGVDLILLKDENALRGEVYEGLLESVTKGVISEDRVESAVARVLTAKERCGLLAGRQGIVDMDELKETVSCPEHKQIAVEAAEKSLVVLKDKRELLPLKPGSKVLVVEQVFPLQNRYNNDIAHPGALYYELLDQGIDASYTDYTPDDEAFDRVQDFMKQRASEADVIVHTGFFNRGTKIRKDLVEKVSALGKPTIFVTNCPYETIVPENDDTVLVTFSGFNHSMKAAASLITGKIKASASLAFDPKKEY